jgi:hypothetical protein
MHSNHLSAKARKHLLAVKSLPCSVCGALPPSSAHHIKQGQHFTCVALCHDCHQGPKMGWHGERRAWKVRKLDELDALAVTLENLL